MALCYARQRVPNIPVPQCESVVCQRASAAEVFVKSWTMRRPPYLWQAKVVVGWDVMGCVFDHFLQIASNKWFIQNLKFMCSKPESTVHQLQRGQAVHLCMPLPK